MSGIEACLTVVFANLAVIGWVEGRTAWSIRKLARTAAAAARIGIRAGNHALTAPYPLPDELRHALDQVHGPGSAHHHEPSRVGQRHVSYLSSGGPGTRFGGYRLLSPSPGRTSGCR
ncbi:hypothetical protein [Micromonospora sp. SL4-19]|uniref:hypothetical protein n=1 Tax=Micromonospora sp. SL4-19 TaxID=3399129 RepID=UPI003A4D1F19